MTKQRNRYMFSEDDLGLIMRSVLIATRKRKELEFLDYFLFYIYMDETVTNSCYNALKKIGLIELEWSDKNGQEQRFW